MKVTVATILLGVLMTGCFNTEAPKCSDEDVQETLKQIYVNVLDEAKSSNNIFLSGFTKSLPETISELSKFRAVSYDQSVKLRTCKADALFDTNQTTEITYTVQLNEEDSDQFYVELNTDFMDTLMQQSIMRNIFNKTEEE